MDLLLLGPAMAKSGLHQSAPGIRATPHPDHAHEFITDAAEVRRVLEAARPGVVFTGTSFTSNLERLVIREARQMGIPTLAIVDYWLEYRARFAIEGEQVLPDLLLATDERMRSEMARELGPTASIRVVGNPHLSQLALKPRRLRSGKPGTPARFRFFSENLLHYFPEKPIHEFEIFEHICRFLNGKADVKELVVRPHPLEQHQPWQLLLNRLGPEMSIRLAIDTLPFNEVLEDECVAIGISTMALLEVAVCGTPTFSYQIDVPADQGYFFLPFEEYGIFQMTKPKDLDMLLNPESLRSRGFHEINNALEKIEHCIVEMAYSPGESI